MTKCLLKNEGYTYTLKELIFVGIKFGKVCISFD